VNPRDLGLHWRERAELLERYGARAAAEALRACASELEASVAIQDAEALTLAEAAVVSGYAVDSLARLIRTGKLRNIGRKRAPRVLAADLPRKPTRTHVADASRQTARLTAERRTS
jgi:hypothetical protein